MIVVTSGASYIDIDAYACCVAYAELLNLLGKPAVAASSAVWNESITKSLVGLNVPFSANYIPQSQDTFVVVDISDPSRLDTLVDLLQVVEVIDHHTGFEQYWAERLGNNSNIEFIGAAATLIYEQWAKAEKLDVMSEESAQLLAAAILDNTLNFGASITTDRDKQAYQHLSHHADLNDDWVDQYFSECQEAIFADLPEAIKNDTKYIKFPGLDERVCLGQIVVWDAKSLINYEVNTIATVLSAMSEQWIANVVSVSDGKSYIVAENEQVQKWVEYLLNVKFEGLVAEADRLWLRKEIMKNGGGI